MSIENLKEYARRCAEEPELRAKAKELGIMDLNAHQELAASLGLDWTMDDMDAFRKEVVAEKTGIKGIDDEDLDRVAGGALTVTGALVAIGIIAIVGAGAAGAATSAGNAW